jgi:LEA14-like dessication related protein
MILSSSDSFSSYKIANVNFLGSVALSMTQLHAEIYIKQIKVVSERIHSLTIQTCRNHCLVVTILRVPSHLLHREGKVHTRIEVRSRPNRAIILQSMSRITTQGEKE